MPIGNAASQSPLNEAGTHPSNVTNSVSETEVEIAKLELERKRLEIKILERDLSPWHGAGRTFGGWVPNIIVALFTGWIVYNSNVFEVKDREVKAEKRAVEAEKAAIERESVEFEKRRIEIVAGAQRDRKEREDSQKALSIYEADAIALSWLASNQVAPTGRLLDGQPPTYELALKPEKLTKAAENLGEVNDGKPTLLKSLARRVLDVASRLRRLDHLRIIGVELDASLLQSLRKLESLRYLDLPNSKLTDATLASFPSLPKLESLNLARQQIEAPALPNLPSLLVLDLGETKLTDEGLKRVLTHAPQVKSIQIDSTRVSNAGSGCVLCWS